MKIVKISAIWCGSCISMKNKWKKIEETYNKLNIINLDYDLDNEEVEKYYDGNVLPATLFFDDNGNEIARLIGERNIEDIISIIENSR